MKGEKINGEERDKWLRRKTIKLTQKPKSMKEKTLHAHL